MGSTIDLDCKEEEVIGHLDKAKLATLEEYCNNVTNIDPKERNVFIIGVAMTIWDLDLSLGSLQKELWCHGKFLKPSRKFSKILKYLKINFERISKKIFIFKIYLKCYNLKGSKIT